MELTLDNMKRRFDVIDPINATKDHTMIDLNAKLRSTVSKIADIADTIGTAIGFLKLASLAGTGVDITGKVVSFTFDQTAKSAFMDYLKAQLWNIIIPPQEVGTGKADLIIGNPNGGQINLYLGNDIFIANSTVASYEVHAGNGQDSIIGSQHGNDSLYGEAGNDMIIARSGAYFISGGTGNDWIELGTAGKRNSAIGDAGSDTLIGGASSDALYGVNYPITELSIIARGSPLDRDFIIGSGGHDSLYGSIGADILIGDDIIDAQMNTPSLTLITNATKGKIPLTNGVDGNDTIIGYAGNDLMYGGGANDILYGDDKPANIISTVRTGTGNDVLSGDAGNDTIYGGWGNDQLYGGTQNDVIYDSFAFSGMTQPATVADNDTIFGGDGNDNIYLTFGNDIIDGGGNSDNVYILSNDSRAFVYNNDLLSNTPIVQMYDTFNLSTSNVAAASHLGTIRNVENIAGTFGDDMYVFNDFGYTIRGSQGKDTYVLNTRNILNQPGINSHTVVQEPDGNFSVQLKQAGNINGVEFYQPTGTINRFWVENAQGAFTQSSMPTQKGYAALLPGGIYDDYFQGFNSQGYPGRPSSSVTYSPGELNATNINISVELLNTKVLVCFYVYGTIGETHFIEFELGHTISTDIFKQIASNTINFNAATDTFSFDFW